MKKRYNTSVAKVLEVARAETLLTSVAVAETGSVKLTMVTFFDKIAQDLHLSGGSCPPTVQYKVEYKLSNGTEALSTFGSHQLANAVASFNSYVEVL